MNQFCPRKRHANRKGTQLEQSAFFATIADNIGEHVIGAIFGQVTAIRRRSQRRADDLQPMNYSDETLARVGAQSHRASKVSDTALIQVVDLEVDYARIAAQAANCGSNEAPYHCLKSPRSTGSTATGLFAICLHRSLDQNVFIVEFKRSATSFRSEFGLPTDRDACLPRSHGARLAAMVRSPWQGERGFR